MTLRFLKRLSDFMKIEMPLLGRWRLSNSRAMKLKIDAANMDHCGTCLWEPQKLGRRRITAIPNNINSRKR